MVWPIFPLGRHEMLVVLRSLLVVSFLLRCSAGGTEEACRQDSGRLLVVVRTYRPTPAMVGRMKSFAVALQKSTLRSEFVISVDTTNITWAVLRNLSLTTGLQQEDLERAHVNASVALYSILAEEVPTATLHNFTISDIRETFPVWNTIGRLGHVRGFHVEPLLLGLRHAQKVWDHVWVFEDDVGLCGDLGTFLQIYQDDSSDFIGGKSYIPHFPEGWSPSELGSEEFVRRFPEKWWRGSLENVQRLSLRFTEHLQELVLNGVTAWSAKLTPTFCETTTRFTCAHLKDATIFWMACTGGMAAWMAAWMHLCKGFPPRFPVANPYRPAGLTAPKAGLDAFLDLQEVKAAGEVSHGAAAQAAEDLDEFSSFLQLPLSEDDVHSAAYLTESWFLSSKAGDRDFASITCNEICSRRTGAITAAVVGFGLLQTSMKHVVLISI
ncbi:unnamed protein product [Polarella glacialis]|uniref:Protein xylosyltransferase n=1 Tax=Polarella glacialis TaxID=89957 RepID=A0A813IIF8_POLGL|nr:unnamed protein product [Polarella glacialis]